MKIFIKPFALSFLFVLVFSCGDEFLDLENEQAISNDQFLLTVADFESAIYGSYDQMQLSDWYGRYMLLIPDIMGEDVKQNASANRGAAWAQFQGAATTTQNEHQEFWAELYEAINMANNMINSDFEPIESLLASHNQVIGQAYALRALSYFDLVRLFAQPYNYTEDASHDGVPVVVSFDVEGKPSRNTVAEVYTQIVADLTQAISLMTVSTSNTGVFTKEGAEAILSRVYLYMEDYSNAEAMATQVINSGRFDLVDSAGYATQFLDGNSSEAIFEIVFDLVDNVGSNHIGGMYKASGYGDYLPSQDILDLFADTDVRGTLFSEDSNLDGGIYASADGIGRRVNKYPSEGANIATDNVPVIRLSEVYLIRAEARAKSATPDEAGALADLNAIHLRSNPSGVAYELSGQDLIDEIMRERRRELCFEGHGIFDINRTKQDLERDDCTAPESACFLSYPNERFILAIPQNELDANENVVQNPGYGI